MTDIEMYMPKGGVQGHAGQATMVEASRAEMEVRAQVVLARQFPRDVTVALRRIEDMFGVRAMADRSFFSYPKGGGKNVTGSTIHLAKAVAQAWGNLTYGIDEMSRTAGQSEMRAWAWDLETNQRTSTTFIVQHAIDVKDGMKELKDLRSIYENNANMANRRLRAQIESVIPAYVMDVAKDAATKTLRGSGKDPLPVRIDRALKKFAELGVEADQVERERGREAGKWSEIDLGHLRVLLATIGRGEISVAEAFPAREMTVEDVRPGAPVVVVQPEPTPDLVWDHDASAWEQPTGESVFEESGAWSPQEGPAKPWPVVAQPGSGGAE